MIPIPANATVWLAAGGPTCGAVSPAVTIVAVAGYLAGTWWPAAQGSPEAFAILTVAANADLAPFHDRQMIVLRRDQRMVWLDLTRPEGELLQPLLPASFRVLPMHRCRPSCRSEVALERLIG